MPLLLAQNGPDAGASAAPARGTVHRQRNQALVRPRRLELASTIRAGRSPSAPKSRPTSRLPTTTAATTAPTPPTVTRPVATTAPSTQVALHGEPNSAAQVSVPPTTTTSTLQPEASATGPVVEGQVTYYDHPAGTCASPRLPFGTVVRITNPANGASVTCVVNDREMDTARAIDLATATFAELAPLWQGVIDAELSW